jgi:sugar phosphate isomerase/epimerase
MAKREGLPVLGAALMADDLERMHNWVMDSGRDLELQEFCYAEVLNADWKPLAERYRRLLEGHTGRVGIHGPFWGLDIASRDPDIRKIVTKRMMQGLDACEAVGANLMVIHSPYTFWDHRNFDNGHGEREALARRCRQTLRDVVKRAEDIGCTIVLENIEDIDPHARVELARAFESPAMKVSLDTGHAQFCQVCHDAPPIDYFVKAAGKDLAHIHIQDADGYADRHWAPGEGNILWRAVFEAIAHHCDNPRLILELNDRGSVIQGAQYLESIGVAR